MEHNITQEDGAVRLIIACTCLIFSLDLFAVLAGTSWVWVSVAIAGLGAFMAVTGLAGVCPIYAAIGRRIPTEAPA